MARGKKHTPEQIVNVLRQIEVAIGNGQTTPQACKEAGVAEQAFYRRRREYGGPKVELPDHSQVRCEHAWPWLARTSVDVPARLVPPVPGPLR